MCGWVILSVCGRECECMCVGASVGMRVWVVGVCKNGYVREYACLMACV